MILQHSFSLIFTLSSWSWTSQMGCPIARKLGSRTFLLPRRRGGLPGNEYLFCLPQLKFFSNLNLNSDVLTHVSNCSSYVYTWISKKNSKITVSKTELLILPISNLLFLQLMASLSMASWPFQLLRPMDKDNPFLFLTSHIQSFSKFCWQLLHSRSGT